MRQFIPDPAAIVPPAQRVAWFKSDTGVTSAGSRVSSWTNIWGNGDLAQATGAAQPLLVSSAFAGFDGIQADSTARFMEVTVSPAIASGSRAYIWAFMRTDTNAASKRYFQISNAANAPIVSIRSSAASNLWNCTNGDGTTTASANSTVSLSTTPALCESGLSIGGAGVGCFSGVLVNGTAFTTTNASMALLSLFTGAAGSAGATPLATVFELIVMSAVPSYWRKVAMRQYFRKRYGAI